MIALDGGTAIKALPREMLLNGRMVRRYGVEIGGKRFAFGSGVIRFAALEDELFEDIDEPETLVKSLARSRPQPDIFTFSQRIPDLEPRYDYPFKWESLAVLPVSTYDHWWNQQVKGTTRNMVRKSRKLGVDAREVEFDDEFVHGMVGIFNESELRQGRRFWHYGKSFETVKREFSRFLFRETLIGAYYEGELIGFVMLANAGRFGVLGQFISKLEHRDKATNNALIAKTVEVCAQRKLPYLAYTTWGDSSLVDFKRYSGFEEMRVPRYFVPVSMTGRVAMGFGLERFYAGLKQGLPDAVRKPLKLARAKWYGLQKKHG